MALETGPPLRAVEADRGPDALLRAHRSAPDGRTVFALGAPPSTGGELVRYDASAGLFVPFLGGLSGPRRRVLPRRPVGRLRAPPRRHALAESSRTGADRRQLTFPPADGGAAPLVARRALDCLRLRSAGERWRSAVVAAEGGTPQTVGEPGEVDPTWSPDGTKVLVGFIWDWTTGRTGLRVIDLRTGNAAHVPGSEGFYSPRWSPDGRSIVALSAPADRLAIYEFGTGRWRDLVAGRDTLAWPSWTRDGKRVQLVKGDSIVLVRAADGQIEPVVRLERIALVSTPWGAWTGLAPDDSSIALKETSTPEVYAFDIEWP